MTFEEFNFKRKDREQLVYIAFDVLDAIFLPRPNLRRNIIIHRNVRMLLNKLGNLQVKARIIDQNNHIRLPLNNILLAFVHILKDGTQMQQDRNEPHIGQFLIMFDTSTSHRTHQITTEKAEIRLGILFLQGTHQVRCMKIP